MYTTAAAAGARRWARARCDCDGGSDDDDDVGRRRRRRLGSYILLLFFIRSRKTYIVVVVTYLFPMSGSSVPCVCVYACDLECVLVCAVHAWIVWMDARSVVI